jgi:hypothetical protein
MKRKSVDTVITKFLALVTAVILVVMPFHAFLTVWGSSLFGHYTTLRLWKEALLAIAAIAAVYMVLRSKTLKRHLSQDTLWRIVGLYFVVTILCGLAAYLTGSVTSKAVLYGEVLNIRPLVMLVVAWVAASLAPWLYRRWQQLVLVPAGGVVAIGLLQWLVLPHDVMRHFGYGASTISPFETIDHKPSYIRIRSTLRGANLLGGYLIMILSNLGVLWFTKWRRKTALLGIVAATATLFASGSRGAWLGLVAALGVILWLYVPRGRARQRLVWLGLGASVILAVAVVVLRNNDFVQNIVFHTDEHSVSQVSSNSAHVSYSVDALKQIIREPLGKGVGSAGPASIYNTGHPARIAENNFLQIGQETGWLGLCLFIALYVILAKRLWQRRHLPLAQILLASFAGLTVMALLMHIWTDDTIAYLWFGLAGIALAQKSGEEYEKTS